ncbi:MAG: SRPBCC domain-containing protein [Candidatus Sulfotelmatobacter sp.]
MATVAITPDQDVVTGEIFIAAPPARVFQAITDPNQMRQWWGASNMYRIKEWKADLRVGGKWPSDGVGVDGKTFRVEGEYLEVDPPRLLVHTWICTWMGTVQTIVRWELVPQSVHGLHPNGPQRAGTGTLVKIRQQGFAGRIADATSHTEGWKRVMGWLVAYIEKGETVDMRR